MRQISTTNAPAAIGPYCQAVQVEEFVFTSGQIPLNPKTGGIEGETITEQTEQVMKNLGAVLQAAGSGFEQAIKTTCYLADINDFGAFNEVYAKYFVNKPARSCFAVKDLPKGALLEVEVIAKVAKEHKDYAID
ncbi:RidA family protein [Erysipelotrichaceae bacterium RD49]|nr:RidA family protein [Erysipelotrichaceae bacterium RD49]